MIAENVAELLGELSAGNAFGEPVTLVAATKTRTPEEINEALRAGITDVGENKVQEFRDKYDLVHGGVRHFIGHLQTNKVKYLIGKTDLYHSIDRDELAAEVAKRSRNAGIVSDVLIQVNIGNEESKGGYPLTDTFSVYERLSRTEGLRVRGFMAMLPAVGSEERLGTLCDDMRELYEKAKKADERIAYLSMGMSGDWKLCLAHGANMIRLGTAIFGARDYASRT
ncbi:MAG: YggS family pyridoxal phosphate-dependent enzyme [Candidatus Gallimonas sp.]